MGRQQNCVIIWWVFLMLRRRLEGRHDVNYRSLYTWKSISSLQEKFFLQDESSFESNAVTKPMVTQATTRHQIEDMDITICPLTPLNFLQPLKVKHFFKRLKMQKFDPFCPKAKLKFSNTNFQMAAIFK